MLIPYIVYAMNEKILGRDTLKRYRELKKAERYSAEELREMQFRKLKALLIHAYSYVEHYKEVFDASGFDPREMKCLDDLRAIPILTKDEIKSNIKRFISRNKKIKLALAKKSGPISPPLRFYRSKERASADKAAYLMLYELWDLNIGDREAVLWGSYYEVPKYNIAKRIRDYFLHTRFLQTWKMDKETLYGYIAFLKNYKPKNVLAYGQSAHLLAAFAKNRGLTLRDAGVKVVFTIGEQLNDAARQLVEEVFGCPTAYCFGGNDILMAFECPQRQMHLNPCIITETVKGNRAVGAGEKGEIVVTDLDSYGIPVIRYRTFHEGIIGGEERCGCGRPFPVLKQVSDRDSDYIINMNKDFLHPLLLECVFSHVEGIDCFKIVQKKEDELVIDLAVNRHFDKNIEPVIRNEVCKVMGGPVKQIIRFVAAEDILKNNKFRFTVTSEIVDKYL